VEGKVFKVKRFTASFLTAVLLLSYYAPVYSQVNTEYEVIPPVIAPAQQSIQEMPEIDAPAYSTSNQVPAQTLQGRVATAPRGTNFEIITNSTINSMSARVGDTFNANIDGPLVIDSQTVIPTGSELVGQITYVESAGRIGKNALMDIRFTSVKLPNGERVPINAKIITTDESGVLRGGKKSNIVLKATGTAAGSTAAGAAAGTSAGAILGSVAGGALFGTAVGGLVGVGYALYRKGKNIILPSGTKLGVTLEQPLTVSNSKVENY
jgi:hypothetical protein